MPEPESEIDYWDRKARRRAWIAEYNAEIEAAAKGKGGNINGEQPSFQSLEDYLDEREYNYQFRVWETKWMQDHPDASGYDPHDFPLYRETTIKIVHVEGH